MHYCLFSRIGASAAPEKGTDSKQTISISYLIFYINLFCGYSLEVFCGDTSNEYQQHVFMETKEIYSPAKFCPS